jgi:ligand-binding sensor domain-containing protein
VIPTGESLNNQTIHSIAEDNEGYLWLGTDKGLFRFDRKKQEFKNYPHSAEDASSISCDTINVVLKGHDGILWLGTNSGLDKFDIKSGKAIRYSKSENGNRISRISCLGQDASGSLWIGTRYGLFLLRNNKGLISDICNTSPEIISCNITSLFPGSHDFMWIGTINGLYKMDTKSGKVLMYKSFTGIESSEPNSQWVTAIAEDNKGELWVGTYGNGIFLMNETTGKTTNIVHNPDNSHSISNNYISSLLLDNQGNIWAGTAWKGVCKFNPEAYRFTHYQHISHNPGSLSNNIVWSFLELPDGKIWVATDGGVNIFNPATDKFTSLTYRTDDEYSLSGNNTRSFCIDRKGNIWIGYLFSGLSCYNPSTRKLKHYSNIPGCNNCLSNNTVWDILMDRNGKLWLGTFDGLNLLDPESETFTHFSGNADGSGLSHSIVFSMLEDHNGNVWIGTNNGLNKFDPVKKSFTHYLSTPGCQNCISNNNIFGLYEDDKGIVWIGTMGGGLNRFDPSDGKFTVYNEGNGLANNVVYDIVQDNSGNLWITTNHGISQFNPATGQFTNFDVSDGLQGYEHNLGAAYKNSKGELFFGGMNGFNILNPEKVPGRKKPSPLWITGFRIFSTTSYREYQDKDTITLNYRDNFFTFLFATIDFNDAAKMQYEYRLDHIDKQWRRTDAQSAFAEYTNIAPGKYTFRLRSISPYQGVKQNEIQITVIIHPPWYATWIFRISVILSVLLLLTAIIVGRIQRLRKKHAMAQAMLDLEKRLFDTERKALRLQMNPHFIFNTLNAIQYFIFQNDKLSANRYISMFSKLMRQILVNSQYNTIMLKDEVEALELYIELELLRFGDKFEFRILVRPDETILERYIPSMILQPYIENAIRHGLIYREEKGLLKIEISEYEKGKVVCMIEDNGVGRERAEEIRKRTKPEHVSMGTKITESRLKLMSNLYKSDMSVTVTDLKNEKGLASGTRIELIIPTFEK